MRHDRIIQASRDLWPWRRNRASRAPQQRRALVVGHFSTVGDIECLDWVTQLLVREGLPFDVAPFKKDLLPAIKGAIPLRSARPGDYSHLIVVCGPVWPALFRRRGLDMRAFAHCTRIGVNLTMVEPLGEWNPFDLLLERDSDDTARPDLTFARRTPRVAVAGICMIDRQREYGASQRHPEVIRALRDLAAGEGLASLEVDTRWPSGRNIGGLRSPAEVISVIERVDVLLTNRLHGLVFALKAGVPALAVDPVAGGNKVIAQARVLGWPAALRPEEATPDRLRELLNWCLSEEGRWRAKGIAARAQGLLQPSIEAFRAALNGSAAAEVLEPSRRSLPA